MIVGGRCMMKEIEIEYKNLLTKEEFNLLLQKYPFPKESQTQTNYYFDTKDRLLAKNCHALRIREKGNTFTLTLKQPHGTNILETHDSLTKEEALAWMNGNIVSKKATATQLKKINVDPKHLMFLGSLKTERYEYTNNHIIMVLDVSIYNGHMDYELEIEAQNEQEGIDFFNAVLNDNDIVKRETPNKIQRFIATLPTAN